jgi:phage shock protein A
MAGVLGRVSSAVKSKINAAFDTAEETFALMYEQQSEYLQVLRRKTLEVVKAKTTLQRDLYQLKADVATNVDQGQEQYADGKSQALQDQIAELELQQRQLSAEDQRIAYEIATFRILGESIKARYTLAQAELEMVKTLFAVESLDTAGGWSEQERTERLQELRGGLHVIANVGQRLEEHLASLHLSSAKEEDLASRARAANRDEFVQAALDRKAKLDVGIQILQSDVQSVYPHLQQLEAATQRFAAALGAPSGNDPAP